MPLALFVRGLSRVSSRPHLSAPWGDAISARRHVSTVAGLSAIPARGHARPLLRPYTRLDWP
eukprot:7607872-Alexandrium_andersonii.AAC.1